MFTEKEKAYIEAQPLARMGTVDSEGQVDVSPVSFSFDGEHFYIGGRWNSTTSRYKNVTNGQMKVALAIDHRDGPGVFAGIKIFGRAEIVEYQGFGGRPTPHVKVTPTAHWSWGIEEEVFRDGDFINNKVEW